MKDKKEIKDYIGELHTIKLDKYVLGKIHALEWVIAEELSKEISELVKQRKKKLKELKQ